MKIRFALAAPIAATLLLLACPMRHAMAQDMEDIVGSEEVWSGIYEGDLDAAHEPELVRQTDRIPARIGLQFGVYFILRTEPENAKGLVTLHYRTHFPDPGLVDPETGSVKHDDFGTTECFIGKACLAGYGIDTPAEIIPGEWRLEVSFRGKLVMAKTFYMDAPGNEQASAQWMPKPTHF